MSYCYNICVYFFGRYFLCVKYKLYLCSFFWKYTLDGFLDDKSATKNTYVFDSIFPDKKSMEQVFPLNK